MTLVVIDNRGRCTIAGARPGAYDAELGRDGVLTLVPLVRATDRKAPKTPTPVERAGRPRDQKNRSWGRINAGTVLVGPPAVGRVVMGTSGRLVDGRTPNQAFTSAGVTANAWANLRLADGRTAAEAYDSGKWG